jgi:hypothetical protein
MSRYMYDAISANIGAVKGQKFVAGYDTGSSDIQWTAADWEEFSTAVRTHIDQGGPGAPSHSATVQDVESGAYTVAQIPGWVSACTAARPTTYVSGENLTAALAASDADIWLASPGMSDTEAVATMTANPRIVAVQNVWASDYDRSIVNDPFWPEAKPVTPSGMPTGLRDSAFATVAQINIAWSGTLKAGVAAWACQLERLEEKGWVLVDTVNTKDLFASFTDVATGSQFRWRVSGGTWSEWVSVSTPKYNSLG